jgi:hypothetical protein
MLNESDKPMHGHLAEIRRHDEVCHDGVFERRTCLMASTQCPACGREVDLWADTASWTEERPGCWRHDDYGPAIGACCGAFAATWFDGCFWYDRNARPANDVETE